MHRKKTISLPKKKRTTDLVQKLTKISNYNRIKYYTRYALKLNVAAANWKLSERLLLAPSILVLANEGEGREDNGSHPLTKANLATNISVYVLITLMV